MDHTELNSKSSNAMTLLIENCLVFITLQSKNGMPTIHVDFKTSCFDTYDTIQQFLVEKGAEFFEHHFGDWNMVFTHFEMDTELTLMLQSSKP